MTTSPLNHINVSNVYVYVSDALRWSALPEEVQFSGAAFKTIASACATMRSLSSIFTGVNPPRHGVASWTDQLTEPTLFDLENFTSGFYNPAAGSHGGLSSVFNRESNDELDDIETPFIYLERDQGGHAPYDSYTYDEMVEELSHTRPVLRQHYSEMVESSVKRFQQRLETLSERGLRDDTLIIFLGDHGELLGEHGIVSHSSPPTPELVYTPTVFIHPEIDGGRRPETIGHIDIAPTVLSALDESLGEQAFDGTNLFESKPGLRYNDAIHKKEFQNTEVTVYHARGLWDGDGGHVFVERGKLLAPIIGKMKAQGWNWEYWKNNPKEIPTGLWYWSVPYRRHGIPAFSKSKAAERIERIADAEGSAESSKIDDLTRERLEELGYLV